MLLTFCRRTIFTTMPGAWINQEPRRIPMSKRIPFSADTSTGELVCDAIADHVLGWYAKVVSRKDGVVRNTKSFKTYRELASFCHGMFKGFHEVEVGAAENDAITDAQLQAMVDADELPTG